MNHTSAHRAVRTAIQRGTIFRPKACERCGRTPPDTADGRASIQGHHHDYSKPLEVEWLCSRCHRRETPLPKVMGAPVSGVRNGQAKLSPEIAMAIRASSLSSRKLAKLYGVDKQTILRVRWGHHWIAAAPARDGT